MKNAPTRNVGIDLPELIRLKPNRHCRYTKLLNNVGIDLPELIRLKLGITIPIVTSISNVGIDLPELIRLKLNSFADFVGQIYIGRD